jgi:hypothetical protein
MERESGLNAREDLGGAEPHNFVEIRPEVVAKLKWAAWKETVTLPRRFVFDHLGPPMPQDQRKQQLSDLRYGLTSCGDQSYRPN